MKVLAIRGCNLASLAGNFEVDFTVEPLAAAGLYAITGPTGSGKSTLLDALCLALYGSTPRLDQVHRGEIPDVGEEKLSLSDPRNVLRRGTGEGFAEVDFLGIDGIGYRARWMARRARSKSSGKHQKVEMTLVRIADGNDVGGRLVTEVRESIQAKVGLRFEQFTRAVLLAQNEFAVFLRADDNERAELLEMLTGTQRFSMISRRAHERAGAERKRLDLLQSQLSSQLPMDSTARETLDAECVRAAERLAQIDQQVALLESHLRWHEALEQACAAERQAQVDADAAGRMIDDAQARRAALRRIDSVQPARPLLDDCRRLALEGGAIAQKAGETRDALARSDEGVQAATARLASARQTRDDAQAARQAAAPTLDRAKVLSAQLLEREPERATADLEHQSAAGQLTDVTAALGRRRGEWEQAEKRRLECATWLATNAAHEVLSLQWPRWESLLAQATPLANELEGLDKALPGLAQAVDACQRDQLGAVEQARRLEAALVRARALLAQHAAAASAHDATALARTRATLERRRDDLSAATLAWRRQAEVAQQLAELETRAADAEAARAQNAQRLEQARSAHPAAVVREQEAAKSLRGAETAAAESVETLRAGLEPGSPCPVCGSADHPYVGQDPALRAVIDMLRLRANEARTALEDIGRAITGAEATERELARGAAQRVRDRDSLTSRIAQARQEWSALSIAAEAPALEQDREPWLQAQAGHVRESLLVLENDEQAMRNAIAGKDDAQAQVDRAREDLEEANAAVEKRAKASEVARQALDGARASHAAAVRRLEAILGELDGAFADAGWRAKWRADPALFQAHAGERAAAWRRHADLRAELAGHLIAMSADIKVLGDRHDEATRRQAAAQSRLAGVDELLGRLRGELAALLGERTLQAFEQQLADAVDAATTAHAAMQEALEKENLANAQAREACRQAAERESTHAQRLAEAHAALAAWISACQPDDASAPALDRDLLQALLAHGPEWIAAERDALLKLDLAGSSARAVLDDRRRHREAHDARRPTNETAPELRTRHDVALAQKREANEINTGLALRRVQDDERRRNSEAMRGEVDEQAARTRTWEQVDDLIGSSDGRKFRNIAQQMTLDVLLGYANQHLSSLARRYRLERISSTLGLMVVDQDMGDEIRSVLSLSGGESFLVSLALALALASLSSHRIRVESLFIDEGFGSLDAEALRLAIEALDGLQAQGRKVGVISHVQEMTDRIGTQIRVERMPGGKSRVAVG